MLITTVSSSVPFPGVNSALGCGVFCFHLQFVCRNCLHKRFVLHIAQMCVQCETENIVVVVLADAAAAVRHSVVVVADAAAVHHSVVVVADGAAAWVSHHSVVVVADGAAVHHSVVVVADGAAAWVSHHSVVVVADGAAAWVSHHSVVVVDGAGHGLGSTSIALVSRHKSYVVVAVATAVLYR